MQPTKFQLKFKDAVRAAVEYKAMTNKEAREHRRNFWVYNRDEHATLYTSIMERTLARVRLVHLKRKLRDKQKLYSMSATYTVPVLPAGAAALWQSPAR